MAAIYGIGEAFKQGVQGFNEGRQFVDAADARQQQLEQNRMMNEARKIELEQKARDNQDLLTFRDNYGQASRDASLASPLFSPQTNENAAGLAAAKATGNPALIARYTQAYDQSAKQDLFSETVSVLNQAKNADSADLTRVNEMYKTRGIPIQIIRAGNGEVVAEGPGGLRTFTAQGFMNDAARVLNPANAYSNIATQMSNEAQIAVDREAAAERAKFALAEAEKKGSIDMQKAREVAEARAEIARSRDQTALETARIIAGQRTAAVDANLVAKERALEESAKDKYIKNAPDKAVAARLFDVERRYHFLGEDPAALHRWLVAQNPDITAEEVLTIFGAAGVGKPRRSLSTNKSSEQ